MRKRPKTNKVFLNTESVFYEETAENERGILEYSKGFQWGL
jgi:hypothetical protein